eukprot:9176888-Pyramimonas_sp.AAC.1
MEQYVRGIELLGLDVSLPDDVWQEGFVFLSRSAATLTDKFAEIVVVSMALALGAASSAARHGTPRPTCFRSWVSNLHCGNAPGFWRAPFADNPHVCKMAKLRRLYCAAASLLAFSAWAQQPPHH